MAISLMFLGTGSDVGKSIAAAAFCRILRRRGYRVAPFKAQNMSNNSFVTLEGGEIGRAQVVQAEAAGVLPSVHMNPILLKPSTHMGSQIIVRGRVLGQMEAADYHDFKSELRRVVLSSYRKLAEEYDIIVMEGAGSCCEMNLKENDLVNFPMAVAAGASCILVADIDRGGVFAQVIGSMNLMTRRERNITLGFLINKFRGDPGLFSSGIEYIEKRSGRPVFGLIPFFDDILIDPEDSVEVQRDRRRAAPVGPGSVNIAVIRFPAISNFTDLEILERERDVVVNYLSRPEELGEDYDLLVLPGTKNVMEDALWMARSGWKKSIREYALGGRRIMGICGGFQLLGTRVRDPLGVESGRKSVGGLGLLPVETVLEGEKVVRRVRGRCILNNRKISGYEIHMGRSRILDNRGRSYLSIGEPGERTTWEDGCEVNEGRISGTYVHGILDTPGFRGEVLNGIRREKGLRERPPRQGRLARFHQYDRLADHFEAHCDVDRVLSSLLPGT